MRRGVIGGRQAEDQETEHSGHLGCHVYIVYGAIALLTKFNETFVDFPKIQKPNTFTADQAIKKMQATVTGS